ncbi:MAG: DUF4105 domain-containing protein, partial [Myxococcota bacterium]
MLFGLFASLPALGEPLPACTFPDDEPALYVLTVEPRPTLIHQFGHTALLAWDPRQADFSPVYDYGRFSLPPSIVDTVVNYLTMQQAYYVSTNPLRKSRRTYRRYARGVVAQRLALTDAEGLQLLGDINRDVNEHPEFRYNWYSANCSTKIRDRIDGVLGGRIREQMQTPSGTSPAGEVLRHTARHPLWLGLQWGSTRFARQEIADWDAMFLPDPMRVRMDRALRRDGSPLVAETCRIMPDSQPPILAGPPSRWAGLAAIGIGLAAALVALLRVSRSAGLVAIGAIGAGLGTWGTAALIVGLAGTFAPFWGHDNLAFASPLWLVVPVAAFAAGRGAAWPATVGAALLGLAALGTLGSLVFGFAAGNLGFALLFLPLTAAVAWGLGA